MSKKLLVLIVSSLLFSSCSLMPQTASPASTTSPIKITPSVTSSNLPTSEVGLEPMVGLKTQRGQIVIKLYQKEAPNTVANFLTKAKAGFYRSLTFHRVEPGFVVQGGDPLGNGTGGGKISSEINTVPFRRGSVGLARGMDKSVSNDAQFFICLASDSCFSLTNEYVNFGEVVSGMELVDQIQVGDQIIDLTTTTK
jgi:cyclophilin family peptidyl-prolyl cis-trans isomerase